MKIYSVFDNIHGEFFVPSRVVWKDFHGSCAGFWRRFGDRFDDLAFPDAESLPRRELVGFKDEFSFHSFGWLNFRTVRCRRRGALLIFGVLPTASLVLPSAAAAASRVSVLLWDIPDGGFARTFPEDRR